MCLGAASWSRDTVDAATSTSTTTATTTIYPICRVLLYDSTTTATRLSQYGRAPAQEKAGKAAAAVKADTLLKAGAYRPFKTNKQQPRL